MYFWDRFLCKVKMTAVNQKSLDSLRALGPGSLLWVTIFLWLALLPARISSIPQRSFLGASGVHSPANYRDAVVGEEMAVKHGTTLG